MSRLGRIAVPILSAAVEARGLTLAILISTMTGMTTTGPLRAGTG